MPGPRGGVLRIFGARSSGGTDHQRVKERLTNAASHVLSRRRLLAKALFGVEVGSVADDDHYFDVTSVALFRLVAPRLQPTARLLDVGTGAYAILGLSLWKRVGCATICSDVDEDLVGLARENVRRNRAPIEVHHSSYFDAIPEPFDTVVFNPPYVPTSVGERRAMPESRRSQWDGGREGISVIEGFLSALERLDRPATAYMGVNRSHVPRPLVQGLIEAQGGITSADVLAASGLPVDVYVIATTTGT